MYHNVRDSHGRFTSKKTRRSARKKIKEVKTDVNSIISKEVIRTRTRKITPTVLNVFTLDDSASMRSKIDVTVSGFNEVLTAAVNAPTKVVTALCKFGVSGKETFHIGDTPYLTSTPGHGKVRYDPHQWSTALFDAIGFTIKRTEELLENYPKGTKVVVTIFTDGQENASRIWSRAALRNRIDEKVREGWVVNFMGAGSKEEILAVSDSIGIFQQNSMSYDNTSQGTHRAFGKMSSSLKVYTDNVVSGNDSNVGFFSSK